jgi:hypothetical protein
MKKHYLNLITCLLMALTACKKDIGTLQIDAITGKWQQTKLNLHQTDAQAVVHDTTYTATDFTSQDFYQFNRDKTVVISKSGNFSFGGKSIAILAIYISDWVTHYTYSIADSTLTFNNTDGITNAQIVVPFIKSKTVVELDSRHLVLRTVYDYYPTTANVQGSYLSGLVTTAYFTKVN